MAHEITHGRFVWYDLMTTDLESAKNFYKHVIGWETQLYEGNPEGPYVMWSNRGQPIGGIVAIDASTEPVPPPHSRDHGSWLPYVSTPDLGASAKQVKDLGGTIYVEPTDIPDGGRFAVAADPHGASFGLFQHTAAEEEYKDWAPGIGEFSWHELAAVEFQAAFDFYQALFGWKQTSEFDMGQHGIYHMYGQKGEEYGGMFTKTPDMLGGWVLYAQVDDINSAVKAVKEHGGQMLVGPMEVPGGGLIAQCLDPQKALFALYAKQ